MGDFVKGQFDHDVPFVPIRLSADHLRNNSHIYSGTGSLLPDRHCQICKDGCIDSQHVAYQTMDWEFRMRTGSRVGLSTHLAETRRATLAGERRSELGIPDEWAEYDPFADFAGGRS